MYTKTFDPLLIGDERFLNKKTKLIPAIQFETETDEIVILALTFSDPVVRLTLEAIYLVGNQVIDDISLLKYVLSFLKAEEDGTLDYSLEELRELRVELRDEMPPLKIELGVLNKIAEVLLDRGTPVFSLNEGTNAITKVNNFDDLTESNLTEMFGETFTTYYNQITEGTAFIGFYDRYLYVEDAFIDNAMLSLAAMNVQSGYGYESYKSLEEVYSNDSFFKENRHFFRKTRCSCGGELVLRSNNDGQYTLMSCINPFCFEKLAFSLDDFTTAMRIDGLGPAALRDITSALAVKNLALRGTAKVTYKDIVNIENSTYLGDANSMRWGDFITAIEEYDGTIKDFVVSMSLPYIGSKASEIITKELIAREDLTALSFLKLCKAAGVHDMKNIFNMWVHLPSMRFILHEVCNKVNLEPVSEFKICITEVVRLKTDTGVIKYTKEAFVRAINKTLAEKGIDDIRIVLSKSLTRECRVLIADSDDRGTGKCTDAVKYGIPIKTSREFLENPGGV